MKNLVSEVFKRVSDALQAICFVLVSYLLCGVLFCSPAERGLWAPHFFFLCALVAMGCFLHFMILPIMEFADRAVAEEEETQRVIDAISKGICPTCGGKLNRIPSEDDMGYPTCPKSESES